MHNYQRTETTPVQVKGNEKEDTDESEEEDNFDQGVDEIDIEFEPIEVEQVNIAYCLSLILC